MGVILFNNLFPAISFLWCFFTFSVSLPFFISFLPLTPSTSFFIHSPALSFFDTSFHSLTLCQPYLLPFCLTHHSFWLLNLSSILFSHFLHVSPLGIVFSFSLSLHSPQHFFVYVCFCIFIRCFAGDNKIFLYIHRQDFDTMFQELIRPWSRVLNTGLILLYWA